MSTFRGGSGWDQSSWPTNPGTADETEWVYEAATGLLLEKVHDDGKKTTYTYTTEGKLSTRTWARSGSIVTTYGYDADTGEMTSISYSDATPDVTFTYDRAGRQKTIEDVVGTRTFAYRDSSPDDMQLATETIDGTSGGLYTNLITREYASSGDAVGRVTGLLVGTTGDPDKDIDVDYAYDTTTGRLNRMTGPGLPAYGVEYSWHTDSDLVEYVRYKTDASTTVISSRRYYEDDRDLIDYVENSATAGPTTISKYDYVNDAQGRRTSVVYTGTAFSYNNHLFNWAYNMRSELTGADRHLGTNPSSPGSLYGVNDEFDFAYDNIGNRETYQLDSGTATTYTANALNQYDSITHPDTSSDTLVHDDDGNLTQDGTFDYTWDAENRLVAVQTRVDLGADDENPDSGDRLVEFEYDYMGRRVHKIASTYNGSAWVEDSDQVFLYDDWNLVLVLNANDSNAILRKYTWGLDLAGQSGNFTAAGIHGAGGVGGLLAVDDTYDYWYLYDANGNVGQLVENDTDYYPTAAHYEYDPYGKKIAVVDTDSSGYVEKNPFRFSTKWLDHELASSSQTGSVGEDGLYYYGYRYYAPELGRWTKRDPIAEAGGLNLYAFTGNRPINSFDRLGLYCAEDCGQCIEDCAVSGNSTWECELENCTEVCDQQDPAGNTCQYPRDPNEICGLYVWLYTGYRCTERHVYNAAIDAAAGVVECWWDCEVDLHRCGIAALADAAGGAASLSFSHIEIKKLERELARGMPFQREVTTLQSRLANRLTEKGWTRTAGLLRSRASLVSRAPVATGATSVVAGIALAEAGVSIYCGYTCR